MKIFLPDVSTQIHSFYIGPRAILEVLESCGIDVFGFLGGLVVGDDGFAGCEVDVGDGGAVDVDGAFVAGGASEGVDACPLEEYSFPQG